MKNSNAMTKKELAAWHVEQGVQRWGESERAGLEKQAASKSLATLRYDYDAAEKAKGTMTHHELSVRASARETGPVRYQAKHCNEDGAT